VSNEELNKKLAEWAGFREEFELETGDGFWVYPDGRGNDLPNFTQSLDVCFKWLVPKLLDSGYNIEGYSFKPDSKSYYSETNIWQRGNTKHGFEVLHDKHIAGDFQQDDNLIQITALALCRVIEKLIDAYSE